LAVFVFIVPKIGAAADLAIKIPNTQTEEWYLHSVNHTVDVFHDILHKLADDNSAPIRLANIDLDTGDRVKLGDYRRADATYARLLKRITSRPDRTIPRELKRNIVEYFSSAATTANSQPEISERLMRLKGMTSTNDPE
jgi:hypothetical protein